MRHRSDRVAARAASCRQGPRDKRSHICVAGELNDSWRVVGALRRRHVVSVLPDLELTTIHPVLASAAVLALDCGSRVEHVLEALAPLAALHPGVAVVLVNGKLSQSEIAEAYRRGACDYFSQGASWELVADRIDHLCRSAGRES